MTTTDPRCSPGNGDFANPFDSAGPGWKTADHGWDSADPGQNHVDHEIHVDLLIPVDLWIPVDLLQSLRDDYCCAVRSIPGHSAWRVDPAHGASHSAGHGDLRVAVSPISPEESDPDPYNASSAG